MGMSGLASPTRLFGVFDDILFFAFEVGKTRCIQQLPRICPFGSGDGDDTPQENLGHTRYLVSMSASI
jgi:hypothetical protein